MASVFQVLADDTRREVLSLLAGDELTAGQVGQRFELTRQAVSHHLQRLREAGLVEERREGTRRYYRARPEGLGEVAAFVERFWEARLGALARAVEAATPSG
ncbi:MAG: ArsR/SmtB family transcription factor [Acidimicrobiales bacterium]